MARYSMGSIKGCWLSNKIRKLYGVLVCYRFVVNAIVADGTGENRTATRLLAELTAENVLQLSAEQKAVLPVGKKIACTHPCKRGICENGTIFIFATCPIG
jgi:hypothetical protein